MLLPKKAKGFEKRNAFQRRFILEMKIIHLMRDDPSATGPWDETKRLMPLHAI
jgi:hypothetical protein